MIDMPHSDVPSRWPIVAVNALLSRVPAWTATLVLTAAAMVMSAGCVWLFDRVGLDMRSSLDAVYRVAVLIAGLVAPLLTWVVVQQYHALEQAREQARSMSERDPLTGLSNRRHFEDRTRLAMADAARTGRSVVVAILDIDDFKRINDGHGHFVGDLVLQAASRALAASLRQTDLLARWGGEEFAVLLFDAEPGTAHRVLERAMAALIDLRPHGVPDAVLPIRMSIGASPVHFEMADIEPAMHAADEALYSAKRAGKNRICWASGPQAA